MLQGIAELIEVTLYNGQLAGRILCESKLVPTPGQYLLASDPASEAPFPTPVFAAGSVPGGFLAAPPLPPAWRPGTTLTLRGPLGHGFSLPAFAGRVALLALGRTFGRLRPVLDNALDQGAAVVALGSVMPEGLAAEVEFRPEAAISEVLAWADYVAIDLPRASLPELRERLKLVDHAPASLDAQALVVAPMPCGALAECGVCALPARRGWKMACKDGPVFKLSDLI